MRIINAQQVINDYLPNANSYNWYKITYSAGDLIKINVSSSENETHLVGVIISNAVQPETNLGNTEVLVGEILNNTHNVSIKYSNSNFIQQFMGLYLLIISLNDSNPIEINYTINSSHQLTDYNFDSYYQEVTLPIILLVAGIILVVGAFLTIIIIKKWRKNKRVI
jgi:hypothetical protein